MKKMLALFLVLVMAMTLITGCGGSEDETEVTTTAAAKTEADKAGGTDSESSTETPATDEEVSIDIFQFKVEIVDALEAAIVSYEAANPNVTINLTTVGGGDDYGAALRAQFQSGNEPVIFNVGGPQDVKDWMDYLEDLTEAPWADQILDGVASGVTVDGKVYALPYNIEGYGLAYNKAIFEAAGVDASAITTFDALESALATIQEKIDNGDLASEFPLLEAAVSYAAKETWVTGLHSSNIAFTNEFDGAIETFNAPTIEFKHADAFKAYVDLMVDYSPYADNKENIVAVDYATQVDNGLGLERVALIQQGNWVYGGVAAVDQNVADNLGFLPIPLKGVIEDSICVGVPNHWAINSQSEDVKKAAAKDFLNWLYTSEEGKNIIVNEFFFIPPMKGYDDVQPADPLAKDILMYANEGRTMPWVFMGYPTDWGQGVLGEEIQKYYSDIVTWDELVENVKAKWAEMR